MQRPAAAIFLEIHPRAASLSVRPQCQQKGESMNTTTLPPAAAPAFLRFVPFVRTEASALIALFALILIAGGWVGSIGVFYFDADRVQMAYMNFWVFDFCMAGMLLTPWLPLPSLAGHTRLQRLEFMVQIWVVTYIAVALSFEVPWVLLYERIAQAPDAMWAYQWWAYIDGGDVRYKDPDALVLFAESWTCLNAIFALVAIVRWFRSGKTSVGAVHYLMLAAVGIITTTAQYYSTEILTGFPNVDLDAAGNFWAKFIFSNCFWAFMPFVTIYWGLKTLPRLYRLPR